jgi:hypothetical protein
MQCMQRHVVQAPLCLPVTILLFYGYGSLRVRVIAIVIRMSACFAKGTKTNEFGAMST